LGARAFSQLLAGPMEMLLELTRARNFLKPLAWTHLLHPDPVLLVLTMLQQSQLLFPLLAFPFATSHTRPTSSWSLALAGTASDAHPDTF